MKTLTISPWVSCVSSDHDETLNYAQELYVNTLSILNSWGHLNRRLRYCSNLSNSIYNPICIAFSLALVQYLKPPTKQIIIKKKNNSKNITYQEEGSSSAYPTLVLDTNETPCRRLAHLLRLLVLLPMHRPPINGNNCDTTKAHKKLCCCLSQFWLLSFAVTLRRVPEPTTQTPSEFVIM